MPSGRKKTPAKAKKRSKSRPASGSGSRFSPGTWIGLLVFASVWMFVLGLLVGRGSAPLGVDVTAVEKKLAAMIDSAEKEKEEQAEIIITELKLRQKSEGYDGLKTDADDPVTQNKLPPPKETAEDPDATQQVKLERPEPKPAQRSDTLAAGPVQSKETAYAKPSEARNSTADTGKTFTVHVHSMKNADNAMQKVVQLKRQGFASAHMARVDIPGKGVYYRVMVGRYKERDDAVQMMNRLKRIQIVGAVISR